MALIALHPCIHHADNLYLQLFNKPTFGELISLGKQKQWSRKKNGKYFWKAVILAMPYTTWIACYPTVTKAQVWGVTADLGKWKSHSRHDLDDLWGHRRERSAAWASGLPHKIATVLWIPPFNITVKIPWVERVQKKFLNNSQPIILGHASLFSLQFSDVPRSPSSRPPFILPVLVPAHLPFTSVLLCSQAPSLPSKYLLDTHI